MARTKLAIACQGGGSHTAFTAGVLRKLFEQGVHEDHEIVGLSGTSGGAICALLAWKYLLLQRGRDRREIDRCLLDLWRDNTAQMFWERLWNDWTMDLLRLQGEGLVPEFKVSPYRIPVIRAVEWLQALAPRREFVDFERLLTAHVDFEDLRQRSRSPCPRLLLGAVDVETEEFKTFDSWNEEITLHAVLASAAIPTLFRAVHVRDHVYWDGLFSENPPINPFLSRTPADRKPQEIWIVRINPERRDSEPTTMPDILDRRNELAGDLSLQHEIDNVFRVNRWMSRKRLAPDQGVGKERKPRFQPVVLRQIKMREDLAEKLDSVSKLDRSPAHINGLIAAGEQAAESFLADPPAHEIKCRYDDEADIVPNYLRDEVPV